MFSQGACAWETHGTPCFPIQIFGNPQCALARLGTRSFVPGDAFRSAGPCREQAILLFFITCLNFCRYQYNERASRFTQRHVLFRCFAVCVALRRIKPYSVLQKLVLLTVNTCAVHAMSRVQQCHPEQGGDSRIENRGLQLVSMVQSSRPPRVAVERCGESSPKSSGRRNRSRVR